VGGVTGGTGILGVAWREQAAGSRPSAETAGREGERGREKEARGAGDGGRQESGDLRLLRREDEFGGQGTGVGTGGIQLRRRDSWGVSRRASGGSRVGGRSAPWGRKRSGCRSVRGA
jgi:hypothetical protein